MGKYKIAVMGSSGVGKTVFLASYFHQVMDLGVSSIQDGRKHYQINIKSQNTHNKLNEMIRTLFRDRKVVAGTDVRVDFSFSVPALDMDIEMFDLPGGFTDNMDYWEDEGIKDDLLSADGIIFFISGDDLVHRSDYANDANRVFASSISKIREHTEGDLKGRADVPVWIIFTKGDLIPNVSKEELETKVRGLLDMAHTSQEQGNFLAKLFKKGQNVETYKTTAMGSWDDMNTPPAEYRPYNVLEPMEDLFVRMTKSRRSHSKILTAVLGSAAALIIAVLFGTLYYLDGSNWSKLMSGVNQACERQDFNSAIAMLDNYETPYLSTYLPSFIRSDKKLANVREDIYKNYERELYAVIYPALNNIKEHERPNATDDFLKSASQIEHYLSIEHFAQTAPEHYDRVKAKAWYFAMGRLFRFEDLRNASAEDKFNSVMQFLNYEEPENWRESIQSSIDGLLHDWAGTADNISEPNGYLPYIKRADQLINHPKISQEVANFLNECKSKWNAARENLWLQVSENWLAGLNGTNPDDELKLISNYLSEDTTNTVKQRLIAARDNIYANIADNALKNSPDDIDELNDVKRRYPYMTEASLRKIQARVDYLSSQKLDSVIASIRSSKSIDELADYISGLEELRADAGVSRTIHITFNGLLDEAVGALRAEVGRKAGANAFADARKYIMDGCSELMRGVHRVFANKNDDSANYIANISDNQKDMLDTLFSAHVDWCKRGFQSRSRTNSRRDVAACIDDLNKLLHIWPDKVNTQVGREAKQAFEFLNAIQGGITGRLTVVEGDFSKESGLSDTPDMMIEVYSGSSKILTTPIIYDQQNPVFNASITINWNVDMGNITFKGIEVDTIRDDNVFEYNVNTAGFKGYTALNSRLINNGNTLSIRFDPEKPVPPCPW